MNRMLRSTLVLTGVAVLVLAAGFFLQLPSVTGFWPWPTSRLSNIFIASILAASAVPVLWIGLSGELAAIAGGALNLCVANLGMAAFGWQSYALDATRRPILLFAMACSLLTALCLGLVLWSRQIRFRESRSLPRPVRVSFAAFAAVLVLVGGALVQQRIVFPWRLGAEQSVLYGCVFLGAACYFLYALLRPNWANGQGQLLGFLAYDLVLIVPFARHFEKVEPALWLNLAVYTGVLVYSGLLALFYLFVNRQTRFTGSAA